MARNSTRYRKRLPAILISVALTACTSTSSLPKENPSTVQTVLFPAPSVAPREMRFAIILPESYEDSDQRYPVLYLLHGDEGGNYLQ